jgi:hypothetical protein
MMVDLANLAAKELKRNIQFNIKLVKKEDPFQKIGDVTVTKTDLFVVVLNLEKKTSYEWPLDKFESRQYMIKQIVEDIKMMGFYQK